MEGEGKVLYKSGMLTVREVTPEEEARYSAMRIGVTQTADAIYCVAEKDGIRQVLVQTADGVNRIRFKV